ncbi:hypothetical protein AGMMS50249_4930 [candidate division SR1 bacterium]|nr:hypothetical protein AGMMS50249_4930 [candidate division SR1 bacterium]
MDFASPELKTLVDIKLADVNYDYHVSEPNYKLLEKQIISDLKPVLNKERLGFSKDDLLEIYEVVIGFME